jgi:HPt (histidine-containing phosphotransfer) domain-containing protein
MDRSINPAPETVVQSLGFTWSQFDLGEAFDLDTLSVVAALDPSGVDGVLAEILLLFQGSLEPVLARLEHHRANGSAADIRFEAHRLKSAAAQLGALRLSSACSEILKRIDAGAPSRADMGNLRDGELGTHVDTLATEIIRVQRQLRRLLQP